MRGKKLSCIEKKQFGQFVKQTRKVAGLSLTQLALQADICRSYLPQIEAGQIPSSYVIARIAYVVTGGGPEFSLAYSQILASAGLEPPERTCLLQLRKQLNILFDEIQKEVVIAPDDCCDKIQCLATYASAILDHPAFYPGQEDHIEWERSHE